MTFQSLEATVEDVSDEEDKDFDDDDFPEHGFFFPKDPWRKTWMAPTVVTKR